ncbi:MAG: serine hydrolase domain-containing protein [Bacteroidota bacterium]
MKNRKQQHNQRRITNRVLNCLLLLLFSVSCFTVSCGPEEDELPSTLSNDISNANYVDILESRLATLPVDAQVAIALVHGGGTEYLGVINENDVLHSSDNANSVFEIGSITKVFTSICLSKLAQSGEIRMNETLAEQFDYPINPAARGITMEQLANHTSGLPRLPSNVDEVTDFNIEDPYATYTNENLRSYLQNHLVLDAPVGTEFQYSNLGMGLLGYVLAQKQETSFEELVQKTILQPLNMISTTTLLEDVEPARLVEPRDINGEIVSHWNFAEPMTAAGSLKSSVVDLVKFIRKNFEDDPVYTLPQTKTSAADDGADVGLGWLILEDGEFTVYLHNGGTGGFSSIMMLDKNKEIGVVVLSNVEDYDDSITPLCNDLFLEISN